MSDPIARIKKKLQDEIDQLDHELNVDLPKEIAVARAHGDLSENAEYKYAKERQGFVNARIGQLKKRLGDLGMLNLTNIPKDRSGYGSTILEPYPERSLGMLVRFNIPRSPRRFFSWPMRALTKPCRSFAYLYSAFSDKSPWARATAISLGNSTFS